MIPLELFGDVRVVGTEGSCRLELSVELSRAFVITQHTDSNVLAQGTG